jgi:hypothetical protein
MSMTGLEQSQDKLKKAVAQQLPVLDYIRAAALKRTFD